MLLNRVIEVVQKTAHFFAEKMQKMEVKKTKKSHAHHEPDFKDWASFRFETSKLNCIILIFEIQIIQSWGSGKTSRRHRPRAYLRIQSHFRNFDR